MPNIENAPVPPTQFSDPSRRILLAVGQDALGESLVRGQANLIRSEFERDDAERTLEYWNDMRQFYGIEDEDEESLPLTQVAAKYQFTGENREHAESKGGRVIAIERMDADYYASSATPEHEAYRLWRGVEVLQSDLRKQAVADPNRKAILGQYLDSRIAEVPPIFRAMRDASSSEPIGWHDWLTDKATPEQFLNFVQWNNYRIKQFNDAPSIKNAIAQEKEEYATKLKNFVAEGSIPLPEHMLKLKLREVELLKVHIGDVFSTLMRGWGGYYTPQMDPISKYAIVDINHIRFGTKHEMNHALLGSFIDRWLNEATTEHVAVAMRKGKMKPVGDVLAEGVYNEERQLLDTLMTKGAEAISHQTLLQGYTEPKFAVSKDSFETAVERSWGPGALHKIAEIIQTHEKKFMALGYLERDVQVAAVHAVNELLLTKPSEIFGKNWVKPVLAGSRA